VEYFFRFANVSRLWLLLPFIALLICLRLMWYKYATYRYSLGSELRAQRFGSRHKHKIIFFLMRLFVLFIIALLIARPQLVDSRSNVLVDGIDMMLVLDVSGSMRFADSGDQKKSRFVVAKQEAIRFIDKRVNDPIGLVIFGKDAISRCPMTTDKNILKSIVNDLHLGVINQEGTFLSTGLLIAANRMKDSQAKSKVIILLTDGEPTEGDQRPETAIEVARRMGIKIYTIGIGSDADRVIRHPWHGLMKIAGVNKRLLSEIARQTGGQFFMAENQKDMRQIYDTIDKLEKTEYETDVFSRYYDLFMPFLWVILAFVLLEIVLSSLLWFGI